MDHGAYSELSDQLSLIFDHCDHGAMDWKTLLDGIVGGVVGAGAALLATRQQIKAQTKAAEAERLELRHERSRTAAAALLQRLADVVEEVWSLPRLANDRRDRYRASMADPGGETPAMSKGSVAAEEAVRSVRRGLLTEVPVVADPMISKHFRQLDMLALWYSIVPMTEDESQRVGMSVRAYIEWLRLVVAAYVAGTPMPGEVEPPNFEPGRILDTPRWEPDPKPDGWE